MHLARVILAAAFLALPALGARRSTPGAEQERRDARVRRPRLRQDRRDGAHGPGPARGGSVERRPKLALRQQLRRSERGGNTLSVIDIAARKELKRVDLGELQPAARPHLLGRQALLHVGESKNVGRYDPIKQTVDWKYEVGQDGTHMVLASRDGKKFFTSNIASNTVSILEPGGRWGLEPAAGESRPRARRASTSPPTAAPCGPRTRATAAFPSSTRTAARSSAPSRRARSARTA